MRDICSKMAAYLTISCPCSSVERKGALLTKNEARQKLQKSVPPTYRQSQPARRKNLRGSETARMMHVPPAVIPNYNYQNDTGRSGYDAGTCISGLRAGDRQAADRILAGPSQDTAYAPVTWSLTKLVSVLDGSVGIFLLSN